MWRNWDCKEKKICKFIKKNHQEILAISAIITIVISIYSLKITIDLANESLSNQEKLFNEGINFQKTISSSNWANLEVAFGGNGQKKTDIPDRQLAYPNYAASISFVMVNFGKINPGAIRLNSGDENFETYLSKPINLSAQSGVEGTIMVKQKGCSPNILENCNKTKIKKGNYNLTLSFFCEFCEPDKRNQNFAAPVCIYDEYVSRGCRS